MKKTLQQISGQALIGDELLLEPVDIIIENGIITAIEENPRAPGGWICPALFNAHTHLGDTIAMDCNVTGDLTSLVTPPHGLKHKLLAAASREELVSGMRASIGGMITGGVAGCADFREGGPEGVAALKDAADGLPFSPVIFGRDGGECTADGLGISSARDVKDVERSVQEARLRGKKIAFHAGERDAADVDAALAFDPDLIIHATHATKHQLRQCADRGIPIAVCPRSNWILGVTATAQKPPLQLMQELGCTLYLGTDNVMFVPPDLFSEMAFVSAIYGMEPRHLLCAAVQGSVLTGSSFFIRKGARANLLQIDPSRSALHFSRDPVASITKRVTGCQIVHNVFNS
ncbi:MAG: amidohydrolase [Methanomicrobiales archaeon HGW-Methanomicrobiales-1]|jgi:cytosine/adenosine deaminase-related metal-dependent hydrolase|nr:MAG: amidohydrolase [Methanomicrobiales archaeon HGW-Methanomicrobiales-1]